MIKSVRLKTGIAAPNWSYAPGDIAKVGDKIDQEEAVRWIKAGIADLESGEMPKESIQSNKQTGKPDYKELKTHAKKLGIKGYQNMKKEDLIKAIASKKEELKKNNEGE